MVPINHLAFHSSVLSRYPSVGKHDSGSHDLGNFHRSHESRDSGDLLRHGYFRFVHSGFGLHDAVDGLRRDGNGG